MRTQRLCRTGDLKTLKGDALSGKTLPSQAGET
jgi:hypothetical protein